MIRRAFIAALLVFAVGARASAAELAVFAAGAVQAAVAEIVPQFEARYGVKVVLQIDTVGALRDRVLAGESPAVVMLSEAALQQLEARGRLVPGTTRTIGRTGIGIAARAGSADVPLDSVDAFKAFLLQAPGLAYADPGRGATAGIHFKSVLEKLGIEETLRAHVLLVPFGGEGVHAVASGKVLYAVSQASEIVTVEGVRLLGLLPESLQLWTVYGAAAVGPAESAIAASWLDFLVGPNAAEAFRRVGFAR